MPGDILGDPENDLRGALLIVPGDPLRILPDPQRYCLPGNTLGQGLSRSGTNLIVFDRRVQYGDIGGPLVSVAGGQVIGIVGGVFDPVELEGRSLSGGCSANQFRPVLRRLHRVRKGAAGESPGEIVHCLGEGIICRHPRQHTVGAQIFPSPVPGGSAGRISGSRRRSGKSLPEMRRVQVLQAAGRQPGESKDHQKTRGERHEGPDS